ncbi:hypothetical protein [Pseudomonas aeruginosa]|uniref:hypothetical protein n=1 Tax=Pseudomonas aeruginosa TaxID=287 RepID=UPI0027D3B52F|nr:hypothetical protein [Pseudomonas aeruginosa]MDQ4223459.1 hypothetical protein [Pseudomonas aeruginosa]
MISYRCTHCGAETRHDHDGNGCHACLRGVMRSAGSVQGTGQADLAGLARSLRERYSDSELRRIQGQAEQGNFHDLSAAATSALLLIQRGNEHGR